MTDFDLLVPDEDRHVYEDKDGHAYEYAATRPAVADWDDEDYAYEVSR